MPMNNKLLRPKREVQAAPVGYNIVNAYSPDIFFNLPERLYPDTQYVSFPVISNLIQLASFHNAYYLPFRCVWTIQAAVYDPPVTPNSFANYYAPERNVTKRWGLPFGSAADSHVTDTVTVISYSWPGEQNQSLLFNNSGECVTVYKLLGEDNPWSGGRSMATLGGVEVLWYTRKYRISLDPAKGAAWVIRRELFIDNNDAKLAQGEEQGFLGSDIYSWVDRYYFATGYAAVDRGIPKLIADSYTPGIGNFPFVLGGGPPSSGWAGGE